MKKKRLEKCSIFIARVKTMVICCAMIAKSCLIILWRGWIHVNMPMTSLFVPNAG